MSTGSRSTRSSASDLRRALVAATVLSALAPSAARADDPAEVKRACATAALDGQRLRADGKLLAAHDRFLACAREACPALVRSDCAGWLAQTDAATPTLVVRAKDERGADVTDAHVTLDDAPTPLDGRPVRVDPGEHAIVVERGGAGAKRTFVVGEGEKDRLVVLTIPSPRAPAPSPAASRGAPSPFAWALGGLALAATASFAYFGLTGRSELSDLRATCPGHCAQSDVDRAWNKLIVADVSLAIAVLAAGGATYLFLAPRDDGAAVQVGGRF